MGSLNKKLSLIVTILAICSVFASAVIATSFTQYQVEDNTSKIIALEEDCEDVNAMLNEHEVYIQVITSKLDNILEDLTEIKGDVKVINQRGLN